MSRLRMISTQMSLRMLALFLALEEEQLAHAVGIDADFGHAPENRPLIRQQHVHRHVAQQHLPFLFGAPIDGFLDGVVHPLLRSDAVDEVLFHAFKRLHDFLGAGHGLQFRGLPAIKHVGQVPALGVWLPLDQLDPFDDFIKSDLFPDEIFNPLIHLRIRGRRHLQQPLDRRKFHNQKPGDGGGFHFGALLHGLEGAVLEAVQGEVEQGEEQQDDHGAQQEGGPGQDEQPVPQRIADEGLGCRSSIQGLVFFQFRNRPGQGRLRGLPAVQGLLQNFSSTLLIRRLWGRGRITISFWAKVSWYTCTTSLLVTFSRARIRDGTCPMVSAARS